MPFYNLIKTLKYNKYIWNQTLNDLNLKFVQIHSKNIEYKDIYKYVHAVIFPLRYSLILMGRVCL